MTDRAYWIWTQLVFGIGSRRSELMLHYFGHPKEIAESLHKQGKAAEMLTGQEAGVWQKSLELAETIETRTLKKGCRVITPEDAEYPDRLHAIYARPAALYVKGDLTCLQGVLAIGMVGSRKASEYGERAASHIASGLGAAGAVVVSGLANGIDANSHRAALEAGGKTIGVLGCGIDIDYPSGSAALKRAACENGAVITEFPLGSQPLPHHFPIRNRIISGLSHGTVVVEAGARSGALITAQHALEQGRDVFGVPGSIFSAGQEGVHALLKDGAKPVTSAADILEEYPEYWNDTQKLPDAAHNLPETSITIEEEKPAGLIQKAAPLPEAISDPARAIYSAMTGTPATAESLSEAASQDLNCTLSALTELELFELIELLPGRRFQIKK